MIAERTALGKPLPARWQDLSTVDFSTLDPERTVALLPVAAIEQHGPHLPLATDATIAEGLVARLLARLPSGTPLLVLPLQAVGKSDEHVDYPGTLTLSAETLVRLCCELGASVRRAGVRKLILLNSHGGQVAPLQIVARELRRAQGMLVVAASWFAFGLPAGVVSAQEQRHGIHGGAVETAMMLALRPELVVMERARDFRPSTLALAEAAPRLASLGAAGFGWQTQDLHPAGACGDATLASAAMGEAVLLHAVTALEQLVAEVVRLPLGLLEGRPQPAPA